MSLIIGKCFQLNTGNIIVHYIVCNRDQDHENVFDKITSFKKCEINGSLMSDIDCFVPERHSNNHGDHVNRMVRKPLCTYDLVSWSYQVTRGMDYLASKKVRFSKMKSDIMY